ncbi:uncharacterized protein SAPINGB_P006309 [Magnusiomyces paraingens]|uniref:Protein transport protein SFT2 n=1 Tax=Magnusiomyces paraingens TaxID=2606893 RepID=A0A5E8C9F7_9ASCO|nr:uncharacterized protein SAPINGB_P006309 [Saprochaete ingens]VVT58638.1 unnamed protein product [Saprochaete ingens]
MSGSFEQAFKSQLSSWRGSLQSGFSGASSSSNTNTNNSSDSILDKVASWNPFANNKYISLPITEPRSTPFSSTTTTNGVSPQAAAESAPIEEPAWFNLSYWDRLLIFGICLLGAVACFALCFFIMPVLALKPRKFGVLWSLGSLLFMISFGVLQGPISYLRHLTSPARLPFTVTYFGSIIATLVFSLGLKSTILTILACVCQIIAAIWYAVSYFPMGTQSLKFASRIGARQVTSWINS